MFRYVLDHGLEVKDEGHFNVKLIFLMETPYFDYGNEEHESLRSDMTLNRTLMSRIKVISMLNSFFKWIPNILTMEIKSD